MEHLIVYGTLQPGHENDHILDGILGSWTKGYVKGYLHPEGWGFTHGYPAIKVDPTGEAIQAYCLSSAELHHHWERLDQFEGVAYRRVKTPFYSLDGSMIEGYIYELNQ